MQVPGHHADDIGAAIDDAAQPLHPFRVGIFVEPAEPRRDWRVMERDQRRPLRLLVEPRAQPARPLLAIAPAVPALRQRVEDEDAKRMILDRILDEAVRRRRLRKGIEKGDAPVMIAHRAVNRKGHVADRLAKPAIGFAVVTLIGDVAGDEEEIRPRRHRDERRQRRIEALAVELVRIRRIEPQMDVRDLRDEHQLSVTALLPAGRGSRWFPNDGRAPAGEAAWPACLR